MSATGRPTSARADRLTEAAWLCREDRLFVEDEFGLLLGDLLDAAAACTCSATGPALALADVILTAAGRQS